MGLEGHEKLHHHAILAVPPAGDALRNLRSEPVRRSELSHKEKMAHINTEGHGLMAELHECGDKEYFRQKENLCFLRGCAC